MKQKIIFIDVDGVYNSFKKYKLIQCGFKRKFLLRRKI